MDFRNFSRKKLLFIAVIILAINIFISVCAYIYTKQNVDEYYFDKFYDVVNTTDKTIEDINIRYIYTLMGIKGFLENTDHTTKASFHNYVDATEILEVYKGIDSIRYISVVNKTVTEKFLQSLKSDASLKKVTIDSQNTHANKYIVTYSFPEKAEHEALLGKDLGDEENRYAAIQKAIMTGKPILTGQITDFITQKPVLVLFIPVYDHKKLQDFPNEKSLAAKGMVNIIFGIDGYFQDVIGNKLKNNHIDFEVYDGTTTDKTRLLYDDDLYAKDISTKYTVIRHLRLGERNWTIKYKAKSTFINTSNQQYLPPILLVGGTLISTLIFIILVMLINSRTRAIKLAEKMTVDSKKFQLAVESASDQIVITDINGKIIFANKATEKITGYKLNEILGTKAGKLWGNKMDVGFYQKLWKAIKEEKRTFTSEIRNHKKDGAEYVALTSISPILNKDKNPEFFVSIERDITQEKLIDQMKTDFISLASHQLRTPLSGMKWFLGMLLAGDAGALNEKQRKFVRNVQISNERMIALVNDLLNISRIESGRLAVEPVPTNINSLVTDIVEEQKKAYQDKQITVHLAIEEKLPIISIDPKLIHEAFTNLVTNAVKYTPKGGEIHIQLSQTASDLKFSVKDNGIGIPSAQQGRLFERFFRADNVLQADTDGNGLGLYLTKSIVETSGGKISFTSELSKGSTFNITLPKKGSQAKEGSVSINQ